MGFMQNDIKIKNARIHNLCGIDVTIPKNKFTVITGVSGSGKSSLAFDTLYEEGRKRYLTFSGSQFMIDKDDTFDSITGLSPTVAVEQRIIRQSNPRSTVGTRIKLDTMLAALMANFGETEEDYYTGEPLEIGMFQKNSPKGMCTKCLGAGSSFSVDEDAIFKNMDASIEDLFNGNKTHYGHLVFRFEKICGISGKRLLSSLSSEELRLFKYGNGGGNAGPAGFMGVLPWLMENYKYHKSKGRKNWVTELTCVGMRTCPRCNGTGLGDYALHTTFNGKTISELEDMYINDLYDFLKNSSIRDNKLMGEILRKLEGMIDVGLSHLTLSRKVPTLSGGELQRLFLASYMMAGMDSIIFVFDEPTIGLHEIEKNNLLRLLRRLVDRGNTVVAVEHDENFIRGADYIIDIGPGAGILGGHKIFEGTYNELLMCSESKTSSYMINETAFPVKHEYRKIDVKKQLTINHADLHNLKDVTVDIPLGVMVGIAGVSGSGKSSLIADTLVPMLKEKLKNKCICNDKNAALNNKETDDDAENMDSIAEHNSNLVSMEGQATLAGYEHLKECYVIDQKPIARTKTSCPATYTGIFDRIRDLFSKCDDAIKKGYSAAMFSRNSEGGCPKCKGDGIIHYYVGYGNFIDIECDECSGTGYLKEATEVKLADKNICDVLNMSVDEAYEFFKDKDSIITETLSVLQEVGMGYITLGQATPTISGGESQRIKLAKELSKGRNYKTKTHNQYLYILDEPTTGLSLYDTEKLLYLMNKLVDCSNTIIVTEHDPHILSNCDYIVEMGEGGGKNGGNIIAAGTPLELKNNDKSVIGRFLL